MITKHNFLPDFETYEDCLGFKASDSLFFDIETTGFSPESSYLYLIGVLRKTPEGWQLTQWLSQAPQEEVLLLKEFLNTAREFSQLIHFNGTTFDLPYLKKKAQAAGLPHTLDHMDSLDLYRCFRPLQKLLSLERMNQTSLENFLGMKRRDKMNGKTLIPVCQDYMTSKDPGLEELLLLHNLEDVKGMADLLSLSAYLKFTDPDKDAGSIKFFGIARKDSAAEISFSYSPVIPQTLSVSLGKYGSLRLDFDRGTLCVPIYTGRLLYFFPDYKNYYYLPMEDQAVHKSVAAYVDREYRQQATAATCYIGKEGDFLAQPGPLFIPDYRCSYTSKDYYFELKEEAFPSGEALQRYLAALLKAAFN